MVDGYFLALGLEAVSVWDNDLFDGVFAESETCKWVVVGNLW